MSLSRRGCGQSGRDRRRWLRLRLLCSWREKESRSELVGKREGEEEEENVHVVFGPQNVKSEGSEGFEDFVVKPVTGCETTDEDNVLTHIPG